MSDPLFSKARAFTDIEDQRLLAEIERATALLNLTLDRVALALAALERERAAASPEGHGGGTIGETGAGTYGG